MWVWGCGCVWASMMISDHTTAPARGSPVCLWPLVNLSSTLESSVISTTWLVTQPHSQGIMGNSSDSLLKYTLVSNASKREGESIGVWKIAQHCHAKHSTAAPSVVRLTVSLGQWWNKMVLNGQRVLSPKEIKCYSNLAFGISGGCTWNVYKHKSIIAHINMDVIFATLTVITGSSQPHTSDLTGAANGNSRWELWSVHCV